MKCPHCGTEIEPQPILKEADEQPKAYCVLCGRRREEVDKLVVGVFGSVCLECVKRVGDIVRSEEQS